MGLTNFIIFFLGGGGGGEQILVAQCIYIIIL